MAGIGKDRFWLAGLVGLAFLLTYLAPVTYTRSDPHGALLTAQAIVQQGTIRLDAYREWQVTADFRAQQVGDHIYYSFPLGSSLVALPVVWLANHLGLDMARPADDAQVQLLLSAVSVALICGLIFLISRRFVPLGYAVLLTAVFVFGSGVVSTLGTAFWSQNSEMVFLLLTLLLLVRGDRFNAYLVGFCLFAAYLCRPTAAVYVALALAFIFWQCRPLFGRTAVTALSGFALFVLFSWREFGQVLPDYYLPGRLSGDDSFALALYGHLFSPARGLFVFSPYLLLTLVGVALFFRRLRHEPLFWLAGGWFLLHLLVVSRFPHWWGGWSFGSRLLTDSLPALFLLTLLVAQQIVPRAVQEEAVVLHRPTWPLFLLLGTGSVLIHSYQGLYNTASLSWNARPNIDRFPQYVFDWRYPQFLASEQQLKARYEAHLADLVQALPPYAIGETILPKQPSLSFSSWYLDAPTERCWWSTSEEALVLFKVAEETAIERDEDLALTVVAETLEPALIPVLVNGVRVGLLTSEMGGETIRRTFPLDAWILPLNPYNEYVDGRDKVVEVAFDLPTEIGRSSLGKQGGGRRKLGICLQQLRLEVAR